ncbi:3-hydroxyisobutyrate dehydrogenase [Luteococcus sp. H138]|uniref:3-hydroxyisobutyrate dehydrogenase n=1 Tax=unclassified Luteococcus TaxID=2639923 RepID=UPI00313EF253
MNQTVGFIGLGNMGGFMAANLVKAGFTVQGFDPVPEARERAAQNGVVNCASQAEAVTGAQFVVTSLPNGKILKGAYGGPDGLLANAPADTLFIDCSTVDVVDAREAREMALAAGHRAIESPMSGGTTGAEAGTLTFMVGAEPEDLESARPVLEAMGKKVVLCGGSGAGQAVKLCNNMVLAINMIAVSEAFVLAESLGVEHQAFFDVASNATASCWALNTNCPVPGPVPNSPANRGYAPGFMTALMTKDLGLAASAIELTGTDAKMGSLAIDVYRHFNEGDGATKDFSAIINEIRANTTKEA